MNRLQKGTMMDSCYLIFFAVIAFPSPPETETLICKKVLSSTFLAVEDWAFANLPDGYQVNSIEKIYGSHVVCDMYGPVDVNLLEGN